MTEPKPPVKGELLPACAYCGHEMFIEDCESSITAGMRVWTANCTNDDCLFGIVESNAFQRKTDLIKALNTRSGTYIPADDFGRIISALEMSSQPHLYAMPETYESGQEALAVARKYGSAE